MPTVQRDPRYNDHFKSIGSVAAIWAVLELRINYAIWELANVNKQAGACITSQITAPVARMRALISLVHFREGSQELLKALNKFSGIIDGLARRRNRVVHDPWTVNERTGEIQRFEITADRKLVWEFKTEDVAIVDQVYDDIGAAILEFAGLWQRIEAELPPWPKTQFERSRGILRDPQIDSDNATPAPRRRRPSSRK